ncbi:preprotein translocase subunit SecE [Mucilaginibacter myungsuensis]|uniref:Protein translocase subunit SecE n=1 Tax=Mucilaginibacter myungsuensis TaxID=649104 RepID=A0A929KXF2_9SPHI|nr:preprotein translocase subunit SecE [Mucilaginibacter myungsuensis]MBE9662432.1 preprotein translocase subunit SecE [Mucilaginibacter myungsuensis]MDN3599131.1 preprotein translocase subunit SecE [Mucilaginibacter myungsuensis]
MAALVEYVKESYIELTEKVTWPTWRELQSSAVLVVVAALIIAMVVFGMDYVISYILRHFYSSLA